MALLIDPLHGGQIVKLSDKESRRNLLDTRTGPAGAPGRALLVDHLFSGETGLGAFARDEAAEFGDFSGGRYECRLTRSSRSLRADLSRKGISRMGESRLPVTYSKSIELPSAGRLLRVRQALKNSSSRPQAFLFATEMNLGLKDAHVNRTGEAAGIRRFEVVDPSAGLRVSWSLGKPARLWHFPLETGVGMERIYQGVRLAWVWPVQLAPRRSWEVRWEMSIGAPDGGPL